MRRAAATHPIRVGVIGCGEIAQIMHLPYLHELPQFELAAVCDVSADVVETVGSQYGLRERYTDYRELIASTRLDAVAICTPDHAAIAQAAAEAGLHLIVEKPLAFSADEADAINAAARENGVLLMVGYMKRFDAAYEYAADIIAQLDGIRLIRMHDFAGDFTAHRALYSLVLPGGNTDTKTSHPAESRLRKALGQASQSRWELYLSLLTLCTHDMTVLRGIFGQPDAVESSYPIAETGIVSVLRYPRGTCVFEADTRSRLDDWDEELCVYTEDEAVSLAFPNPFVKHAETIVSITESRDGMRRTTTTPVSHEEAFRREWRHFAACISDRQSPRTTGEDARMDIAVLAEMVKALPDRADQRVPESMSADASEAAADGKAPLERGSSAEAQ